MKVIKVDIKQEVIDLPQNKLYVDFFKASHGVAIIDEGAAFQPPDIERERWQVQEVSTLTFEEPKRYLVRVDDVGIFHDLMLISETTYNRVLHRKLQEVGDRAKEEIWRIHKRHKQEIEEQLAELRALPLWKRILNKWECHRWED